MKGFSLSKLYEAADSWSLAEGMIDSLDSLLITLSSAKPLVGFGSVEVVVCCLTLFSVTVCIIVCSVLFFEDFDTIDSLLSMVGAILCC